MRPFDLQMITPSILGSAAPSGSDLVKFAEGDYARFCRAFERAATHEILRHDPAAPMFKKLYRPGRSIRQVVVPCA